MKHYDVIVIGSGAGAGIVEEAVKHGFKTALVDKGPLGGTCLNTGCIPSKLLIYPADVISQIQEASKLGIKAGVKSINFKQIMRRMHKSVNTARKDMEEAIRSSKDFDFYEGLAYFTADYTLKTDKGEIKADKIFIASGSRPLIPPIKGVTSVNYFTNETILFLKEKPESIIIIGGGYVAVEYGHFFAAIGVETTILEMGERLVSSEESEVSELLYKKLAEKVKISLNLKVIELKEDESGITAIAENVRTGEKQEFKAKAILLASGRVSNADLLRVSKSGIKTDERGYIKVNAHFETTKKGIYAIGDAIGRYMFIHAANQEAMVAASNVLHNAKGSVDYSSMPHAIFSNPQVASVGLTEKEARDKGLKFFMGRGEYSQTAKGEAMAETGGFAKALVEAETGKILGFHIVGPHAPILIQEVVNAMSSGGHYNEIAQSVHIHPALSEIIVTTLSHLEEA